MKAITIENIVAFDYEYIDRIYEAQSKHSAALALNKARGYLNIWRNYHTREHMKIDKDELSKLDWQYDNAANKAFLKRCKELEQNERFIKNKRRRMNKSQLRALLRLHNRSPATSFLHLRRKTVCYYDDYFGINLAGMFIGIERDGYIHTSLQCR